jgi:branched-subunit amino acid ABC-type transport system permease component
MEMLLNPTFFFIQFMSSLAIGMNFFIIAAGLTLIFGVLRVINFAHGVFYMFGAYACWDVSTRLAGSGWGFWLGVVAAGALLAVIAVIVERGFLQFLYKKEHLLQLLFTFAVVLIMGDAAKMIWGTDQYSVPYPAGFDGATNLYISYFPNYLLFLTVIGPVIAVGLWLVIGRTRWGRIIRAATQDREMLSALGMNVPLVYTSVFVLGSVLAGVGGALAAPRIAVGPGMDAFMIVECFVIVVIGGLGSLWGSFFGALALGFVSTFGPVILPNWDIVLVYMLMLAVLLWRPWGLFGHPEGSH